MQQRSKILVYISVISISGILVVGLAAWLIMQLIRPSGDDQNKKVVAGGDHASAHTEQPPPSPSKVATEPAPAKPAAEPVPNFVTFKGAVLADWVPLIRPIPVYDILPAGLTATQDARGLRFVKTNESSTIHLTNQHVLYGDFAIRLRVVFPAPRKPGIYHSIPAFGIRSTASTWHHTYGIASDIEVGEQEHTLEIQRKDDEMVMRLNGKQMVTHQLSRIKTPDSKVPPALDNAFHLFLDLSNDCEVLITDVELTRARILPEGLAAKNEFVPPGRMLPSAFRPRPERPDEQVLMLPGPVSDVVLGSGGRYLIAHVPQTQKLLVFDTKSRSVVAQVPVPAADVRFTAGRDKLVIASPTQRRLERWNLSPLNKEFERTEMDVSDVAMGSNSNGPLLVASSGSNNPPSPDTKLAFLNLDSLQPISTEMVVLNEPIRWSVNPRFRVSAEGTVFGITTQHGAYRLRYGPIQSLVSGLSTEITVIPGPSGEAIFGVGSFRSGAERFQKIPWVLLLPSTDDRFCILCTPSESFGSKKDQEPANFAILLRDQNKELAMVPDVDFTMHSGEQNPWKVDRFSPDKRIHLIPESQTLITIPFSNDRLVFRVVDPEKIARETQRSYLYLISAPPPEVAMRGSTMQHQFQVVSSESTVRFGPGNYSRNFRDTVTVNEQGLFSWNVPLEASSNPESLDIVVTGEKEKLEFKFDVRLAGTPKPAQLAEKSRTWTDRAGRKVEATLMGLERDQIQLKRADGREFTLPLNRLSDKDQRYIKNKMKQAK